METMTSVLFLGSQITVDGDCSCEIKRCLLLGRKAMTNLDSILKSRGFILRTMVCIVKGMVFPIVKYICESWTFIFGDSQMTADGDCSHEIKMLTPWKKTMTNLDVVLKRRNVTLLIKVLIVKAMVFPVVMVWM